MFDNLRINEIFAEKNVPAIIIYLYLSGPKTRTEIYDNVSTNVRMSIKIDMLIDEKIIKTLPGRTPRRPQLTLTEMGMQFGYMLCAMERMAGGDPSESKWRGMKKTLEDFGYVEMPREERLPLSHNSAYP
ncbi:MAG: hypothetical protein IKQ93_08780 [Candidatus Methanomethylophilaceae archaeon]|nr:hypothetical protein [Candidatus Methanomethylophilaceae archaeon]MBR6910745.1 hypothetical protein [Candidatus Methanomethylophilaceae archaeon]